MKNNSPKKKRKKLETLQKTPAKGLLKSKNGRRYSRVSQVHEKNKKVLAASTKGY